MRPDEIELVCACDDSPQQFDAMYNGETIGYLRLRWGVLSVFKTKEDKSIVYRHEFEDAYKGGLEADECDEFFAIARHMLASSYNHKVTSFT